jgi:hypothetical protein
MKASLLGVDGMRLGNIYFFLRRTPGTRGKVSSRRINLEGNTHVQESNVNQLPV